MHASCGLLGVAAGIALSVPTVRGDVMMTIRQQDSWRSQGPAAASLSADGRYVALTSYARLTAADTDNLADVYVLDRVTGAITLESLTVDGESLPGTNDGPRLSGDGRYLVFQATVDDQTDRIGTDVVLRDRAAGTSIRVGRHASGARQWSSDPVISDDGRVVVFRSTGTTLVAGDDLNGVREDVYAFDVSSRSTSRVSVDAAGHQHAEGSSYAPSLSGDGRYVAFVSAARLDVVAGTARDTRTEAEPLPQVFVRDLEAGRTVRVSVGTPGLVLDGASYDPSISRDGRFVAFASRAANLVRNDRNRSADVFVRDLGDRKTDLVSRTPNGRTGNGASGHPSISADGRYVAFESDASDLICSNRCPRELEDVNLLADVFLFDRTSGRTTWMSAWPNTPWAEESAAPGIDADGGVVIFTSRHPVDDFDTAHDFDLFVRVRTLVPGDR